MDDKQKFNEPEETIETPDLPDMEREDKKPSFLNTLWDRFVTQPDETRTLYLDDGTPVLAPFSYTPLIFFILFLVSLFSWIMTNVDILRFIRFSDQFFVILKLMVQQIIDQWDVPAYRQLVEGPLIDTVQMSILGSALGAVLALPAALLASSNINKNKFLLSVVRFFLSIIRTFPVLVYAYFLAFIFFYGTLPGTLAITIFTFAIMSKMLYERIETIDMSAFIAIEATGATKTKSFFTAIIPQIMGTYLSLALYSFEINIRYAAILGYVGAGGIGVILNNRMTLGIRGGYGDALVILIYLFVTVVLIESLSRYLRRRLT